ncbi:MAG: carboxylating nicotinate-nucleotide diphosphorylase [Oscillospiraceae bacterium]|nr:carboxylating nicotinate-nucleotide diphosphorylase [Oscillospiraceae bacterium]
MDFATTDDFIRAALKEDIGTGDITSQSCIPESGNSIGRFTAKESGVICGINIAARVFFLLDPSIRFISEIKDGDSVKKGEVIARIEGPSRSILAGERVALNIMQRLSGISTRTAKAVAELKGAKARITDTRKSTPLMRVFEKYAVRTGGGSNHRFNLADGILIKDNHIAAAGSIAAAVRSARQNAPHTFKIEVETETLEQVAEALKAGADIIMLDNMTTKLTAQAVKLIAGRAVTEASGNMGEKNLKKVAATGVDVISIGALTNDVRPLDISLKFDNGR